MASRDFDFVLLGPTGYTGRLCAEYIVQHLPTNLKWALAGRSAQNIEKIASEIKQLNPDRTDPGMYVPYSIRMIANLIDVLTVQLNKEELNPLSQKTKILINCVGPYHLYSTPVVEACAVNGTHYVDV